MKELKNFNFLIFKNILIKLIKNMGVKSASGPPYPVTLFNSLPLHKSNYKFHKLKVGNF